jgi:hypothetical protein
VFISVLSACIHQVSVVIVQIYREFLHNRLGFKGFYMHAVNLISGEATDTITKVM